MGQTAEARAGEPELLLRGFAKTPVLAPGGHAELPFTLRPKDLSIWDGGWAVSPGHFVLHVGASSRDLRLSEGFSYAM